MRVLITGSEGNIGRILVPHLRKCGYEVLRCDIQNRFAPDYRMVDVKSPADLAGAFNEFEPDAVLHMAAIVSRVTGERSPHLAVDTNISGTNNLIHLCQRYGCKLVYFSSSEVYGPQPGKMSEGLTPNPNNLYGLTKYLGELLVKYEVENYGLNALTLRPFMFYDEHETRGVYRSAMVRFAESLLKGEGIVVHKGAKRSWMHTSDAAQVIERLLHVEGFHTVNIGNPDVVSMLDLAKLMCDKIGIGYDLIAEEDLPSRMTLCKVPDLTKQRALTGIDDFIGADEGVTRLLTRLRGEL